MTKRDRNSRQREIEEHHSPEPNRLTDYQRGALDATIGMPAYFMTGEGEAYKRGFIDTALDEIAGYGLQGSANDIRWVYEQVGPHAAARALLDFEEGVDELEEED